VVPRRIGSGQLPLPDGRRLVVEQQGIAKVVDPDTTAPMQLGGFPGAVLLSEDGRRLAMQVAWDMGDSTVKLWAIPASSPARSQPPSAFGALPAWLPALILLALAAIAFALSRARDRRRLQHRIGAA
jgi:hypothetical protein